jgi:precorrin-3B synthase
MESGDGLVVRMRPRGGRLTQHQARGIAELAVQHGNGLIDLSSRANVQLRGVIWANHAALIEGLRVLGLIDANTDAEARRNIIVSPFWSAGDGVQEVAAALGGTLSDANAPDLPGKFGFSVEAGTDAVLQSAPADIRIERHAAGWLVRGEGFATGALTAGPIEAADAAIRLARWFVEMGGIVAGRGRMAALWADQPAKQRHSRLPVPFQQTAVNDQTQPQPKPGPVAQGLLVGLEFGQMQAKTLALLGDLADLRVTPWRMLLIEGRSQAAGIPGLITDPKDPMLRVVACTGAPGCLQAHRPTRQLARALAHELAEGTLLHVSGCAKGCAHPTAARTTLVATTKGFDLIHNGTAAEVPTQRCLTAEALVAHPHILTEFP